MKKAVSLPYMTVIILPSWFMSVFQQTPTIKEKYVVFLWINGSVLIAAMKQL
jgi:hypothetical protein